MVNASSRITQTHHFNNPRLHIDGLLPGRAGDEVSNPELSQLASVSSFATSLLKIAGDKSFEEKGEVLGHFGSVISGRAVLSGQALEDIKKDAASGDLQERAKFWTAASSFLVPTNIAVKLLETHYLDKTLWVSENIGKISTILAPLTETVRGERAGATALVALKTLEKMSSRASTRERVITHTGVVEAAGGVAKIAASAMGFPSVSLGLGLISNLAGMIKAFTKSTDFVPYQNPLDKEFSSIKKKALTLVENQFTAAIKDTKKSHLPKEKKAEWIARFALGLHARTKEIEDSPDEEVLQRTLIYYDIESHSLFSSELFGEWKTDEVIDLCHQCSTLTDKKIKLVDIKSKELLSQKESIELLQERLDQSLLDLDAVYKEGSIMKEFISQDIKSVKGLLMEETAKIDSMFLERKQNIDDLPPLPMFEAHEMTEDLAKRPSIVDWLERADDIVSQERRIYLEKKVASAFEEPSLMDIIHI